MTKTKLEEKRVAQEEQDLQSGNDIILRGIYFDVRKDDTMVTHTLHAKRYLKLQKGEHISLAQELDSERNISLKSWMSSDVIVLRLILVGKMEHPPSRIARKTFSGLTGLLISSCEKLPDVSGVDMINSRKYLFIFHSL